MSHPLKLVPQSRLELAKAEVVLDDSGKGLDHVASAIVAAARFQAEPLLFMRGRSLVRVVRSALPEGGVLVEPVAVSASWLRHVAIPQHVALRWSDGRVVETLPEALTRRFINEAQRWDFIPVLCASDRPNSAVARLEALGDSGEGWHCFSDALVRLEHPAPLSLVSDKEASLARLQAQDEALKRRLVRAYGGWLHERWASRERVNEDLAALDRLRRDLGLKESASGVTSTLRRIDELYHPSMSGVRRSKLQDVLRPIIDHPVVLRMHARRGEVLLLRPYLDEARTLLDERFVAALDRHGVALRVSANSSWNPTGCVDLVIWRRDDWLIGQRIESSPGYVVPVDGDAMEVLS